MSVSILIPAYNSSKFIGESIRSVLDQTYKDFEIIVVDDGSEDNTTEIVMSLMKVNHHIQLYKQRNKGACAARNLAFVKSKGDYIMFLDADDIISANKIASQLKQFELYGDEIIVSCQWGRFKNDINEALFPVRYLDKDWDDPIDWLINAWEGKGMAQTSIWLTPRNLIEKAGSWDERLKVNQDGEFFARVLLNASGIKFCNEAKIYYRSGNEKSVSKVYSEEKAASLLLSYQLYKEHALNYENSPRVRYALLYNFLNFLYQYNGKYPMLAEMAREEIFTMGFTKLPPFGGRNFKWLAKLIGFENTLSLRNFFVGY